MNLLNPPLRRAAFIGAALAGLILPALCTWMTWELVGSAVRVMLAVTIAALLNLPAPLGGGMSMQGVLRVRWMKWEKTFDADRNLPEALAGAFLLTVVTVGGFFVAAPVVGAVLRWVGPLRTGVDEVLTLGATVLLAAVGFMVHRPEVPLRTLRTRIEQEGSAPRAEDWARVMKTLTALARPDGGIGHLGGIGARTVGLHEHLEAEALLRRAAGQGIAGAAELHARSLEFLASRAEPGGGFSAYPSGMARMEYTTRALEALRGRLDGATEQRHRDALRACRREDGRFGRSATAPASEEATRWAGRAMVSP